VTVGFVVVGVAVESVTVGLVVVLVDEVLPLVVVGVVVVVVGVVEPEVVVVPSGLGATTVTLTVVDVVIVVSAANALLPNANKIALLSTLR
jgi:hypothetical protein